MQVWLFSAFNVVGRYVSKRLVNCIFVHLLLLFIIPYRMFTLVFTIFLVILNLHSADASKCKAQEQRGFSVEILSRAGKILDKESGVSHSDCQKLCCELSDQCTVAVWHQYVIVILIFYNVLSNLLLLIDPCVLSIQLPNRFIM